MPEIRDNIEEVASNTVPVNLKHAEIIYKQLLDQNTENAQALYNLGVIAYQQSRYKDAIDFISRAIASVPNVAQFYNTMGIAYEALDNFEQALNSYDKAISIQPDYPQAHHNKAIALQYQNKLVNAIESAERAIHLSPDYAEAYNTLGYIYRKIGRYDRALVHFSKAISLKPDYTEAYNQQGVVLNALGRYEEALESYTRAVRIDPSYAEAHWNRSLVLLLTGSFIEGWEEYKWRRDPALDMVIYPHQFNVPIWDGSSFTGKTLLVHYEQGFGDTIQFIRYLPWIKRLGGTVILEVREPLIELLQDFPGVDILIKGSLEHKCSLEFDFHVSLMDLPGIFQTEENSIPAQVPYIQPGHDRAKHFRGLLNTDTFNIGIVWSGSTSYERNGIRSCKLTDFAPLTSIEGISLYSLQKGEPASQIEQYRSLIPVKDLGPYIGNFADTAALIKNLDLVISVDTSVLHLAGAMGKPVWALLCSASEWRWQLNRSDSPWYPTMRLFRQQQTGCWNSLFKEIADRIKILLANQGIVD